MCAVPALKGGRGIGWADARWWVLVVRGGRGKGGGVTTGGWTADHGAIRVGKSSGTAARSAHCRTCAAPDTDSSPHHNRTGARARLLNTPVFT